MQLNQTNITTSSFKQKSSAQYLQNNVVPENICSGNVMKKCTLWTNHNYNTTKTKLIYDCIKEETSCNKEDLSSDIYGNLRRILLINEAVKCKNFPTNSQNIQEPIAFLGVLDMTNRELKDDEKLAIKLFVEAKLKKKLSNFIARYNDLGGNIKDTLKSKDSISTKISSQSDELILANWIKKIDEIFSIYNTSLHSFFELLINWGECKIALNESRFKSTELMFIQAQFAETQTIISKLSCQLRMFLELPATIRSFRVLKSHLDAKLNQLDDEIQRKLILKKEYEDLKCTEYDDILKKYIDICNAVKKRSIFFDKL